MKNILFFSITFFLFLETTTAQATLQLTIKNIDGVNVPIRIDTSKKTLIMVVPFTNDSVYKQLVDFRIRYKDTIQIVAIPSIEFGFTSDQIPLIKSLYESVGAIVSEGMYTNKYSPNQHYLFQWLTNKSKNLHYDLDVSGIGQKYFLNESGELFGVLSNRSTLQMPIIDKIIHSRH